MHPIGGRPSQFQKEGACFVWAEEHAAAFDSLKQALCQAPVLQILDFNKEFVLATDANDIAISAVHQQRIDGGLAPISYNGRTLSPLECKYSTYEKECLVVNFGCKKCRRYLEHKEFELQCDNLALCWLLKRVKEIGRLGMWILRLSPFKFKVRQTQGVENVADALSRMFDGESSENPGGVYRHVGFPPFSIFLSIKTPEQRRVLPSLASKNR